MDSNIKMETVEEGKDSIEEALRKLSLSMRSSFLEDS